MFRRADMHLAGPQIRPKRMLYFLPRPMYGFGWVFKSGTPQIPSLCLKLCHGGHNVYLFFLRVLFFLTFYWRVRAMLRGWATHIETPGKRAIFVWQLSPWKWIWRWCWAWIPFTISKIKRVNTCWVPCHFDNRNWLPKMKSCLWFCTQGSCVASCSGFSLL